MVLQGALILAYTFLVALAVIYPDSVGGQILTTWITTTDRAARVHLGLSEPSMAAAAADGVIFYRHVFAVSLTAATICFVATRGHRAAWTEAILRQSGFSRTQRGAAKFTFFMGQRLAMLGLVAAALLLLFAEYKSAEAGWPLGWGTWRFFSAPILITVAFGFACYAMALRGYSER
jgi:hypothetical protein